MLKPNFFLTLVSFFLFSFCLCLPFVYSIFISTVILSFVYCLFLSWYFIIMCLHSIYKDILRFISFSSLFTNVCNVFLYISLSLSVILLASSLYIRRECNAYEDFGDRPKNKRFHPKKLLVKN